MFVRFSLDVRENVASDVLEFGAPMKEMGANLVKSRIVFLSVYSSARCEFEFEPMSIGADTNGTTDLVYNTPCKGLLLQGFFFILFFSYKCTLLIIGVN